MIETLKKFGGKKLGGLILIAVIIIAFGFGGFGGGFSTNNQNNIKKALVFRRDNEFGIWDNSPDLRF